MSRVSGFHKLAPGCIHMRCPRCGRKQSNMTRHAEHDHPTAFLLELPCESCSQGCKVEGGDYFDKRGRQLSSDPYYWHARIVDERRQQEGASDGT